MLALLIAVASPSSGAQSVPGHSECLYKPTVPLSPGWLSRLLRRQTLVQEGATVFRRIGDLRSERARYTLYHYIHDTPTAGSCHGIDAVVVLRGRHYVGSYSGFGPTACRVRKEVLICRDTIDQRDYPLRFVGGRVPRNALLGGERVLLRR